MKLSFSHNWCDFRLYSWKMTQRSMNVALGNEIQSPFYTINVLCELYYVLILVELYRSKKKFRMIKSFFMRKPPRVSERQFSSKCSALRFIVYFPFFVNLFQPGLEV